MFDEEKQFSRVKSSRIFMIIKVLCIFFVCKMFVLATIIIAAIQILSKIRVKDKLSIPVNGDNDINELELIYLVRKIGVIIIIEAVVSHHPRAPFMRKIVDSKGREISNIILLLMLLYQILMTEIF